MTYVCRRGGRAAQGMVHVPVRLATDAPLLHVLHFRSGRHSAQAQDTGNQACRNNKRTRDVQTQVKSSKPSVMSNLIVSFFGD